MPAVKREQNMGEFEVTSCYKFAPIPPSELESIKDNLTENLSRLGIKGLILLGTEGINLTAAGAPASVDSMRDYLRSLTLLGELEFKNSYCHFLPFKRLTIEVREEIVTLKRTDIVPSGSNGHLSPAEWQAHLEGEEAYVLIDTRNFYETAIGKFEGAIDPGIKHFSEFPDYVRNSGIDKDTKVLMYCTGGIRCEKASIEMKQQGFQNVYQLEGGILKYLEQFPNSHFDGECFVFDHRVAVDQNLAPSRQYKLCPHCGNPAKQNISCALCGEASIICFACGAEDHLRTCSKNCSHHYIRKSQTPTTA